MTKNQEVQATSIKRQRELKKQEAMRKLKELEKLIEEISKLDELIDELPQSDCPPMHVEQPMDDELQKEVTPPMYKDIRIVITKYLRDMGIPAKIHGYSYLRDAIEMVILDTECIHAVTRELYPEIAKKYKVIKPSRVERSMRHAIEVAWKRGNCELQEKIFGYTVSSEKGKPTNSEFISMLADYIMLECRS